MRTEPPVLVGTHRDCNGRVFMFRRKLGFSATLGCIHCRRLQLRGDEEVDWFEIPKESII